MLYVGRLHNGTNQSRNLCVGRLQTRRHTGPEFDKIRDKISYLVFLIGPELHTGGNDGDARLSLSLYMWECHRWTGIGADTVSHGHIVGDRDCVAEGFVKAHSTQ